MRCPISPIACASAFFVLATAVAGCSRRAEVVLRQPFAPPSQQQMELKSRWAFSAMGDGHCRCLLGFPSPGSDDGTRDFHVYLTFPDVDRALVLARDEPDGARGFLIQEIGLLRGKTEFTDGTVRCRRVFLYPRLRRLDLDVRCADGASVSGKAYVEIDEREMHRFEQDFAADVKRFSPAEGEPEGIGQPTAPRTTSP
jgi:hypothetical protein